MAARRWVIPGSVKGRESASAISCPMRTAWLCPSVPYTIAMSTGAAASRRVCTSDKSSSSSTEDAIAALALQAPALAGTATSVRGSGPPSGSWRNDCPPGGTAQPYSSASSAKAACGLLGLSKDMLSCGHSKDTRHGEQVLEEVRESLTVTVDRPNPALGGLIRFDFIVKSYQSQKAECT